MLYSRAAANIRKIITFAITLKLNEMKKFLFTLTALLIGVVAFAQNAKNDKADSIVGKYFIEKNDSKVEFVKNADGTYKGFVYWSAENGAEDIVLVDGLKYNAEKKRWDGAKISDPTRGIKANCTILFTKEGMLQVSGKVMGIGETHLWKPIAE